MCQHKRASSGPMPRRQQPKPYHHGNLRRALLDATVELAAEVGAAGVTLREAARLAGVSQTAPYRHFNDKQEMLAAAAEEGMVLLLEALQAGIRGAKGDPDAELVAISVAYVRFALDHTRYFRLMFGHGSPHKSVTPGLQQAGRAVFQLLLGIVARSLKKPPADPAARQAMFRIWALAHGIAVLALEKQILFDIGTDALLAATRQAVAAQLPL